ncbi:MAG: hypothetical protein ABIY51_13345 [Ferruginibacter sp.]
MTTAGKYERTTKVFLQLGLDGRTISSSAYPGFIFGGGNSARH